MARYAYRCTLYDDASHETAGFAPLLGALRAGARFHDIDRWFDMGKAPVDVSCEIHATRARRIFDFQFQQDNRRLRGEGMSMTTGKPYAQSRAEERVLEKTMGIEFVGPADRPREWVEAQQYSEHLRTGGNPVPWREPLKKTNPADLLASYEKNRKR